MCPVCLVTGAALAAGGASVTGGLMAFVLKVIRWGSRQRVGAALRPPA